MNSTLARLTRVALAGIGFGLLSACANMANTPPGTPLHQVEAQFGRANFSCPGENGGQRLIWSQQPYGQYAWGTNVNSAGITDHIEPLLTDKHFNVLATGVWTPERVQCEFGPPAEITQVGLPSSRQTVWGYRYKQSGAWNSLMYVYFGTSGEAVTRFHPGPDPLYERESFWFN
ncbi:hypothetical protein [Pollutimonas harenae]|uniref:Lipoprotein n=1 Tax=Pollutimonas harenae TaxID=657015 RepID=A0A853H091_9BURK|nr:hypothetical protein [Pollutimonas harenae]NYT85450.1 hypothetical protein [Pollutimonas harenae]TEA70544.1 hypothetical protein ERD84_07600 [Pollutimonas harenae]